MSYPQVEQAKAIAGDAVADKMNIPLGYYGLSYVQLSSTEESAGWHKLHIVRCTLLPPSLASPLRFVFFK